MFLMHVFADVYCISYFAAFIVVVNFSYVVCHKCIRQKGFKNFRGGKSSLERGGGAEKPVV